MNAKLRLTLSAVVAFVFYGLWAFWANRADSIPMQETLRAALVQGTYSGLMTLTFTYLLENVASRFQGHYLSLALVTPFICSLYHKTKRNKVIFGAFEKSLLALSKYTKRPKHLLWISPLLPLAIQTVFVVGVNWLNQTPNLLLTVLPSIIFSGIYGYAYLVSFVTTRQANN